MHICRMKCVVVLLSLLSLGHAAPMNSCDSLLKPISVSKEDILGRWKLIAMSADFPGSRSLAHLMSSLWWDQTATSKSNEIRVIQNQKILGQCYSLAFNVIFENSSIVVEQPFYLKEVYLSTECADCLVAKEDIISGEDSYTNLLMFGRSRSASPASLEKLTKQAECLQLRSPLVLNPNSESCPDNTPSVEGISVINSALKDKMGQNVGRLLDTIFDIFVN